MSAFRLESLERQLSVSVPTADLDAADRAYAELTANYRELLGREQGTGAAERRAAEAEAAATAARSERQALAAALEDSRQRVISLEATVTTASSGGGDDSVQTLCKQVSHCFQHSYSFCSNTMCASRTDRLPHWSCGSLTRSNALITPILVLSLLKSIWLRWRQEIRSWR